MHTLLSDPGLKLELSCLFGEARRGFPPSLTELQVHSGSRKPPRLQGGEGCFEPFPKFCSLLVRDITYLFIIQLMQTKVTHFSKQPLTNLFLLCDMGE